MNLAFKPGTRVNADNLKSVSVGKVLPIWECRGESHSDTVPDQADAAAVVEKTLCERQ